MSDTQIIETTEDEEAIFLAEKKAEREAAKAKREEEKSGLIKELSEKIKEAPNKSSKRFLGITLGAILNENNKQFGIKRTDNYKNIRVNACKY
jgi:hypothetical protein